MSNDSMFELTEGRASDAEFLAGAILQAERAHTGRGIWDLYYCDNQQENLGSSDSECTANALKCLQHVVENAQDSVYYYKRFTVIRMKGENGDSSADARPVACACGFKYPEVTMANVLKGLRVANTVLLQWNGEQSEHAEARLSFMSHTFPEGVDFSGRWMVEGVFTDPSCRGQGLARRVMERVLERGRDTDEGRAEETLITCAVDNAAAFQLYTKLGFQDLGSGDSEECMQKMGTKGFHVLRYVYAK